MSIATHCIPWDADCAICNPPVSVSAAPTAAEREGEGRAFTREDRELICEHCMEFARTSKNSVLRETAEYVLTYERMLAAAESALDARTRREAELAERERVANENSEIMTNRGAPCTASTTRYVRRP
jgi:hypothetical protein